MVRVNIIPPENLADQHLIAEYNEILMLVGHARKHPSPETIPEEYCLGRGHINFFKNKLKYLQKRHEQIRKEMKKRGYKTNKRVSIKEFPEKMRKDWKPSEKDREKIRKRLNQKIRQKPAYYTHYRNKKSPRFFQQLLLKQKA